MDKILALDEKLLLLINGFHCETADALMWAASAKMTWLPLYLILILILAYRYRRRYKMFLLIMTGIVLTIACADLIASQVIKNNVCRLRPTHNDELLQHIHVVNGYYGGLYGFVSNHAADTMSLAVIFSLIWRNTIVTTILLGWVGINCYSRMYLGVHYPLDIVGGLLLGSVIAYGGYKIIVQLILRLGWYQNDAENASNYNTGAAR